MSGIGEDSHPPEWEALRAAAQAYSQAVYDSGHVLQDFVLIGFVVSMEEEVEYSEYTIASSSQALHVNEGLIRRGLAMLTAPDEEE
jgi:hypothetical protein